jgi:hypothetical protein
VRRALKTGLMTGTGAIYSGTFTRAGNVSYHREPHPSMKGAVQVDCPPARTDTPRVARSLPAVPSLQEKSMRPMQMAALSLALTALVACSNSDAAGPQDEHHHATLAASPAVTTAATGEAQFTVQGTTVLYTVGVANIDSVTAVHIHVTSSPSTILANLYVGAATPAGYSGTLAGTDVVLEPRAGVTIDSVLKMIRIPGATYVNVHTMKNRPGEIRGDIIRQ